MRIVKNWIVKDVHEAPIIAGDQKGTVGVRLHLVNMSAIFARWVDSLDGPAKFDRGSRPQHVFAVRKTGGVMSLLTDVKVELFVSATNCSDVR